MTHPTDQPVKPGVSEPSVMAEASADEVIRYLTEQLESVGIKFEPNEVLRVALIECTDRHYLPALRDEVAVHTGSTSMLIEVNGLKAQLAELRKERDGWISAIKGVFEKGGAGVDSGFSQPDRQAIKEGLTPLERLNGLIERLKQRATAAEDEAANAKELNTVMRRSRDEFEQRMAAAEAEAKRRREEMGRAYGYMPLIPGVAPAWDGDNLTPHIVALADEWTVREEQLKAAEAVVAKLRPASSSVSKWLADVADHFEQHSKSPEFSPTMKNALMGAVANFRNVAFQLSTALAAEGQGGGS